MTLSPDYVLGGAEFLTPERVFYLVATKGHSQVEIGKAVGRSRQWVSVLYARGRDAQGAGPTLFQRMNEYMPFEVADSRMTMSNPYRLIRLHLRWTIDRDSLKGKDNRRNLFFFYNRMADEVVEYSPHIPPHDGVYTGGFQYLPRDPSDGRLILRVNRHVAELSDEMIRVWRVPPESEWPRD